MTVRGARGGGGGGLGLDLLISPDDDGAAIGIPLATSLAGLLIAAHATRNDDRSFSDPAGDLGASLLHYGDDGLTLGTPLPIPTMLPFEDVNGRSTRRPGITMELFRAKF